MSIVVEVLVSKINELLHSYIDVCDPEDFCQVVENTYSIIQSAKFNVPEKGPETLIITLNEDVMVDDAMEEFDNAILNVQVITETLPEAEKETETDLGVLGIVDNIQAMQTASTMIYDEDTNIGIRICPDDTGNVIYRYINYNTSESYIMDPLFALQQMRNGMPIIVALEDPTDPNSHYEGDSVVLKRI